MDQNNQPNTPMNNNQTVNPAPEHKNTGPMISILVIILILIIGLLYMFASRTEAPIIPTEYKTPNETVVEVENITNQSDNVSDLETDLNASVEGLDQQSF